MFKPFFMKQSGNARTVQLYDADGPSPLDKPRSAWTKAGHGTTYWMLNHEGPLLASQQVTFYEPCKSQMRLPAVEEAENVSFMLVTRKSTPNRPCPLGTKNAGSLWLPKAMVRLKG